MLDIAISEGVRGSLWDGGGFHWRLTHEGLCSARSIAKSSATEARSGLAELGALAFREPDALPARLLPLLFAARLLLSATLLLRAATPVRRLIVRAVAVDRLSAVSTRCR